MEPAAAAGDAGLLYGVLVYFFMNDVVIPLSALQRAPRFSPALLVNGVLTHALLVGLPSAWSAKLAEREAASQRTR
jgi:hypothetical protein